MVLWCRWTHRHKMRPTMNALTATFTGTTFHPNPTRTIEPPEGGVFRDPIDIDAHGEGKDRLGVEMPLYRIAGARNPTPHAQ